MDTIDNDEKIETIKRSEAWQIDSARRHSSQHGCLTTGELNVFIGELLKALRADDLNQSLPAFWMVLALCTNRELSEIKNHCVRHAETIRQGKLPRHIHLYREEHKFTLAMPLELQVYLSNKVGVSDQKTPKECADTLQSLEYSKKSVRKLLKYITKKAKTKWLHLNQVHTLIENHLELKHNDILLSFLLFGSDKDQHANGAHYLSCKMNDVERVWHQELKRIGLKTDEPALNTKIRFGKHYGLEYFENIRQPLTSVEGVPQPISTLIRQHNTLILIFHTAFCAITGLRPSETHKTIIYAASDYIGIEIKDKNVSGDQTQYQLRRMPKDLLDIAEDLDNAYRNLVVQLQRDCASNSSVLIEDLIDKLHNRKPGEIHFWIADKRKFRPLKQADIMKVFPIANLGRKIGVQYLANYLPIHICLEHLRHSLNISFNNHRYANDLKSELDDYLAALSNLKSSIYTRISKPKPVRDTNAYLVARSVRAWAPASPKKLSQDTRTPNRNDLLIHASLILTTGIVDIDQLGKIGEALKDPQNKSKITSHPSFDYLTIQLQGKSPELMPVHSLVTDIHQTLTNSSNDNSASEKIEKGLIKLVYKCIGLEIQTINLSSFNELRSHQHFINQLTLPKTLSDFLSGRGRHSAIAMGTSGGNQAHGEQHPAPEKTTSRPKRLVSRYKSFATEFHEIIENKSSCSQTKTAASNAPGLKKTIKQRLVSMCDEKLSNLNNGEYVYLLANWVKDLAERDSLGTSSIKTYFSRATSATSKSLEKINIHQMDDEDWQETLVNIEEEIAKTAKDSVEQYRSTVNDFLKTVSQITDISISLDKQDSAAPQAIRNQTISNSEYHEALHLLEKNTFAAFLLLLYFRAGLRKKEALGLKQSDITFNLNTDCANEPRLKICVQNNECRKLKTHASTRIVRVFEHLHDAEINLLNNIEERKERIAGKDSDYFLFLEENHIDNITVEIHKVVEALRHVTNRPIVLHTLRHTYVTRLTVIRRYASKHYIPDFLRQAFIDEQSIEPAWLAMQEDRSPERFISSLLGHSGTSTTFLHYDHLSGFFYFIDKLNEIDKIYNALPTTTKAAFKGKTPSAYRHAENKNAKKLKNKIDDLDSTQASITTCEHLESTTKDKVSPTSFAATANPLQDLILIAASQPDEWETFEQEIENNNWSVKQLKQAFGMADTLFNVRREKFLHFNSDKSKKRITDFFKTFDIDENKNALDILCEKLSIAERKYNKLCFVDFEDAEIIINQLTVIFRKIRLQKATIIREPCGFLISPKHKRESFTTNDIYTILFLIYSHYQLKRNQL